MNWMDDAVLLTLKSDSVAKVAYNAALLQSNSVAPGVLKFFCICYNKILNDDSKNKLDAFFKEDDFLKEYYKKYKIVTIICKQEPLDPMNFISENKIIVDKLFQSLNMNTPNTIEELTRLLNQHIVQLIELIQQHKNKISTLMSTFKIGGKTKRKKRKKSKHKSRNKFN